MSGHANNPPAPDRITRAYLLAKVAALEAAVNSFCDKWGNAPSSTWEHTRDSAQYLKAIISVVHDDDHVTLAGVNKTLDEGFGHLQYLEDYWAENVAGQSQN